MTHQGMMIHRHMSHVMQFEKLKLLFFFLFLLLIKKCVLCKRRPRDNNSTRMEYNWKKESLGGCKQAATAPNKICHVDV